MGSARIGLLFMHGVRTKRGNREISSLIQLQSMMKSSDRLNRTSRTSSARLMMTMLRRVTELLMKMMRRLFELLLAIV